MLAPGHMAPWLLTELEYIVHPGDAIPALPGLPLSWRCKSLQEAITVSIKLHQSYELGDVVRCGVSKPEFLVNASSAAKHISS